MKRIPGATIPTVIMPVFFVIAFSNTFRGVTLLPGFPTDNIHNWMVPYACVQSASLGAMASAVALGRDLEDGFYDRFLLSPARRFAVPVGLVVWAIIRSFIPITITLVVGTLRGLTYPGGIAAVWWMMLAAWGVAAMGTLWGLGVVYRTKSQASTAIVQIGIFAAMFLSVGMVPLDVQTGWLPHVARFNPVTAILTMARTGFLGQPDWADILPGLGWIAASVLLLGWFAARGMKTLVP
jgi:ABC-2 type transport system permease protein